MLGAHLRRYYGDLRVRSILKALVLFQRALEKPPVK